MKRQQLRRVLACALLDILGHHALTIPNAKRYVTADLLCQYRICKATRVTDQDVTVALEIARNATRGKPVSFRYAPRSSAQGKERTAYILNTPIVELM